LDRDEEMISSSAAGLSARSRLRQRAAAGLRRAAAALRRPRGLRITLVLFVAAALFPPLWLQTVAAVGGVNLAASLHKTELIDRAAGAAEILDNEIARLIASASILAGLQDPAELAQSFARDARVFAATFRTPVALWRADGSLIAGAVQDSDPIPGGTPRPRCGPAPRTARPWSCRTRSLAFISSCRSSRPGRLRT
jgi:hypothetical protein